MIPWRRLIVYGGMLIWLLVACGRGTPTAQPQAWSSATPTWPPPTHTLPPSLPPLTMTLPPAEPSPTATPPVHVITLEAPLPNASLTGSVEVRGWINVTPFENTLRLRIYDQRGSVVVEAPVMVLGSAGQPGTFTAVAAVGGTPGPAWLEVAELSARDGSVLASALIDVLLAGFPGGGVIEVPAPGARVTLPLHILARVGEPGAQVMVHLTWQDGTRLSRAFSLLRGEDGRGLLITNLDWNTESMPPQPGTQTARLEIQDAAGQTLAQQLFTLVAAADPDTQGVKIYWLLGEQLQPVEVRVPRTPRIGTAALEALLWGPPPGNLAGFTTAIPTPEEVLAYPGRMPDWGPRVTLRNLTIVDGIATADFSREITAQAGGATRVLLIREQITQTLLQFSTVKEVVITVEGQRDVLEP